MKRSIALLTATLAATVTAGCAGLDDPTARSTHALDGPAACALLGVDLVPDGDAVVVHGARDLDCVTPLVAELLVEDEWILSASELAIDHETGRFAGRLEGLSDLPRGTPLTLVVRGEEDTRRIDLQARDGEHGVELIAPAVQVPDGLAGTWLLSARQLDQDTESAPAYARVIQEGDWLEVVDLCDPERRLATGWIAGEIIELYDHEHDRFLGSGTASPWHMQAIYDAGESLDLLEAVRVADADCEQIAEGLRPPLRTPYAPYQPAELTLETGLDPFTGFAPVIFDEDILRREVFWPNGVAGGVFIPPSRPNGMDHLMAASKTPWPVPTVALQSQSGAKQCLDPANAYQPITCPNANQGATPHQECVPRTMTGKDVITLANRVLLTPDNDIYPGALLQGRTIDSGSFAPINVPRSGATLTLVGPTIANPNETINAVTLANVEQARQTLIGRMGTVSSRLSIQTESVYSFDDLLVKAGAHVKWGAADFRANFSFQNQATHNYVLVKFSQELYRLVASRPASAALAFRDGRAFNDSDFHIGANNRPVFVSEVGYGRQLFLLVQSRHTIDDITASLKVAYGNNSASASAKNKQVLKESNISFVALGGDAQLAAQPLAAIGSGGDVFKAVVDTAANLKGLGSTGNPAVPVAFTLTDLIRGDKLRSAYSISHTRRDCVARDGRPFKTELRIDSINEGMKVWITDAGTPKSGTADREFSLIHPTMNGYGRPVTSNLTPTLLATPGAKRISLEHHNHGCFFRWADIKLRVDGVTRFSHRLPHAGWGHCGTYMQAHMDVDPLTGAFTLNSYQN